MASPTDRSPVQMARFAGVLYLLLFFIGPFSILYVPSALIVPGDATATAQNIAASPLLFRLGIVGYCVIFTVEIVLSVVLYRLFRPAGAGLSLMAAFARMAQAVLHASNVLLYLIALLLLSGAGYLAAFQPVQLHALVYLLLDGQEQGVLVSQVFFGFHCLLLGALLYRSRFLPWVLGPLVALAGASYLIDAIGNFLAPQHEELFGQVVLYAAVVGELALTLWLLVRGVDAAAWHRRAREAAAG